MSANLAESPGAPGDHGALSGLSDDDHLQYLLLAGRAGGQQIDIPAGAADGISIRDDAAPTGVDLFAVERNDGVNFFAVRDDEADIGLGTNRTFRTIYSSAGARGGSEFIPDGMTATAVPLITYALQWDSLYVSDIAGGAPFGNDSAPAAVGFIGECRYDDPGNLFSSALLFNQATTMTANGVNVGPAYTMVNQPVVRTGTLGGSRTFSQANAVRSQMRVGPNLAGNVTLTSHEPFFATMTVDATVGTASATTVNYFAPKAPTLTAGGTITTLNCLDLPNIPAAGITNLRGINSAMGSGTFINHTGAAPAVFTAADFQFDADNIGVEFGAGQDVLANWNGSAFELDPAVGDDWRLTFAAGVHTQQSPNFLGSGAELRLGYDRFAFGQTGAVGNQVGVFVANTRSVGVGGEWSDFLLTQAGNITVNAAMSLVAGWTVNAPSITLGTGSVTTAGVLNVGGNVNQGSVNRFGVRILSNPSGGSGVNAALWVTAGRSRFDGLVDLNQPIALGGGATATLGTIGGSGPTAAAQAQWVQIEVNGVNHWIPAWT